MLWHSSSLGHLLRSSGAHCSCLWQAQREGGGCSDGVHQYCWQRRWETVCAYDLPTCASESNCSSVTGLFSHLNVTSCHHVYFSIEMSQANQSRPGSSLRRCYHCAAPNDTEWGITNGTEWWEEKTEAMCGAAAPKRGEKVHKYMLI